MWAVGFEAGLEGGILRGQLEAASLQFDLRQLDRGGIGVRIRVRVRVRF